MMSAWTELLPLFIVRWYAKRACERWLFTVDGNHHIYAMARPDVLVRIGEQK